MKSHDQIAAQLFLDAVLPAFEELTLVSERARQVIARWNCAIELAVRGQGAATIRFADGAISVSSEHDPRSPISLLFFTPGHLVTQFPFVLRRGIFRLGSLLRFQKVGKIFEEAVESQPRLLLSVAISAFRSLSLHDEKVREILRHAPEGMAELGVPSEKLFGWVECKEGRLFSGRGRAPRAADVTIEFRDAAIALAALRGELDELAATGAGDLRIRGLIPLAEILGIVSERVTEYLPRP